MAHLLLRLRLLLLLLLLLLLAALGKCFEESRGHGPVARTGTRGRPTGTCTGTAACNADRPIGLGWVAVTVSVGERGSDAAGRGHNTSSHGFSRLRGGLNSTLALALHRKLLLLVVAVALLVVSTAAAGSPRAAAPA